MLSTIRHGLYFEKMRYSNDSARMRDESITADYQNMYPIGYKDYNIITFINGIEFAVPGAYNISARIPNSMSRDTVVLPPLYSETLQEDQSVDTEKRFLCISRIIRKLEEDTAHNVQDD